jgi:DNA-binding XRE family transcriptional regulator
MRALIEAGRAFAASQTAREAAADKLKAAIRAADAEGGHTRSELVEAAGVARQTVYDALRETPAEQIPNVAP